tara:strand:+ start:1144 stop:1422 length:279 start_codon:yes stop_codon:yes gene_type:complete
MYQRFVKIVLIALSLLFIPFVAMQFTDNVQWTYGDFIIMGCMLTVYMLTLNFAPNSLYGVKKSLLILILGLLFLLLWAELAVGIFSSPFAGR